MAREQLKNPAVVVNDAALRPPTTMAPPVPVKKKISIPSVFLVDDEKKVTAAGNGSATYVRTMDRPPPRPVRPPVGVATGGANGQLLPKCNTLNLRSQSSSSSPTQPPQSQYSSSQLLSLSSSSLPRYNSMPHPVESLSSVLPQPHPPPRRHQMNGSSPMSGGAAGRGTELPSKLSVKVILLGA